MSKSIELNGKSALVLGASGGMGRAIVERLSSEGVRCAAFGRNRSVLDELAQSTASGAQAIAFEFDLGETNKIEAAARAAINALGGLHFFVNAAGATPRGSEAGSVHDGDLELADHLIAVNLKAYYHFVRHTADQINKQPGGAIVRIGAVNYAYSGSNLYTAANLGGEGYAEVLFEDVREYGTKVCTIRPGWVNTPLVENMKDIDFDKMIQPADIADAVHYVLRCPATACPRDITILPQYSPYT